MVVLGLLLIAAGVIAILSAIFVSEGSAELLGIAMDARGIFLVGVGAGAATLWGFSLLKFGTRRELRARRERKELSELSKKLDQAESDRKKDDEQPT
jgi:hypothetical protein